MPSEIFAPEILAEIKSARQRMSVKEIAARLGVTPAHVSNALMLADAPSEIHDAIERGEISPTSAIPLLRTDNPISALIKAREYAKCRGFERVRFCDVQDAVKPSPMRDALWACLAELTRLGADESVAAKKAYAALN